MYSTLKSCLPLGESTQMSMLQLNFSFFLYTSQPKAACINPIFTFFCVLVSQVHLKDYWLRKKKIIKMVYIEFFRKILNQILHFKRKEIGSLIYRVLNKDTM